MIKNYRVVDMSDEEFDELIALFEEEASTMSIEIIERVLRDFRRIHNILYSS